MTTTKTELNPLEWFRAVGIDPVRTGIASLALSQIELLARQIMAGGKDWTLPQSRRLVDAAPDLLAACEQALRHIQIDETAHGRAFSAGNVLRAAIGKAVQP